VVSCLSGFLGCGRKSAPPETLYRSVRLTLLRGDYPTALQEADEEFRRYKKSDLTWAWRYRILKAEVFVYSGRSLEALALLHEDLPSSLSSDEAAVRGRLTQGLASAFLQEYDHAHMYMEDAERIAGGVHPELLAEVARDEGTLAFLQGNYDLANSLSQRALRMAHEQNQPEVEATALNNLGGVATKQQHCGEALDRYKAALRLFDSLGSRSAQSSILGNIGWCYFKLGDYEQSVAMTAQAEAVAAQLGNDFTRLILLENLGLVRERRVSTTLRHGANEFSDFLSLNIPRSRPSAG
jgi:tetratricopeptide (TPR) repeat protein